MLASVTGRLRDPPPWRSSTLSRVAQARPPPKMAWMYTSRTPDGLPYRPVATPADVHEAEVWASDALGTARERRGVPPPPPDAAAVAAAAAAAAAEGPFELFGNAPPRGPDAAPPASTTAP